MYYQIRRFDPSNTFVKITATKTIKLVKMYTEQKMIKTNALVQMACLMIKRETIYRKKL